MNESMIDRVERYLNGELSQDDRSHFEAELETNEELASLLNVYSTIETEMRNKDKYSADEDALKNTLEKLNAIYFTDQQNINPGNLEPKDETTSIRLPNNESGREFYGKPKTIKLWTRVAVAAGILGIIALGVTWHVQKKDNSPVVVDNKKIDSSANRNEPDTSYLQKDIPAPDLAEEKKTTVPEPAVPKSNDRKEEILYASHFKPDIIPENVDGPLEDAFVYYENEDFKNAISAIESADLNTVVRGQETDVKHTIFYAHYYKALSFMAAKNVAKAIPELMNAVAKSPDSSLQIKAQWYLALAYLKSSNVKKTDELLNQIADNNHEAEYKAKASVLRTELKR